LTGRAITGDATFHFRIDKRKWNTVLDEHYDVGPRDEYPSRFRILERKRKWVRYVEVNEFYTEKALRAGWISRQLDLFEDVRARTVRAPYVVPYQFKLFEERAAA
jgi:hypothetical protein